ncbi:MAG: DUF362 domain-containing protein [Oscillospiraceae bacterium]|nr:DUF362 domain-containing protein [Oscillospiraceae bacterium]
MLKLIGKLAVLAIMAALTFSACGNGSAQPQQAELPTPPTPTLQQETLTVPAEDPEPSPPPEDLIGLSLIFVEQTTGVDDGVERLVHSMEQGGQPFYRTQASPHGLFGSDDVVLLKINAQWDERGGTNTDLIRGVAQAILDHPEGFTGEVVIADNGQAQFGSARTGGSLNWTNNNAEDPAQSVMSVAGDFQSQGYQVTGVLWDTFTRVRVGEFNEGDYTDGFVVEDYVHSTGLEISYPKFTTEFGTQISFREGIWDSTSSSYDSERLRIINMPVLKHHGWFQVTGAVKNYMGTPSDMLTGGRAHLSTGTGGMGTQMAHTRMPALNIMDMIWIGTERGPSNPNYRATRTDLIAASTDAVALDYWTTRYVLIPAAEQRLGSRPTQMNPAGDYPGTFGHWLRLSKYEILAAGYHATMDPEYMRVIG